MCSASSFSICFSFNLFIEFEDKSLTIADKLCLAKEIGRSVITYLSKLSDIFGRSPPDWIILDNCTLLNLIFVDIVLAMTFLISIVRLVARNNSCSNSPSWKFFVFNNIVPVFCFFAADFNLFNCVIVSLTLASWQFAIFCKTVTLPWANFNLLKI